MNINKKMQLLLGLVMAATSMTSLAEIVQESKNHVEKALQTYIQSGPKAFVEFAIKNGALEGNREALSQANGLQQLQDVGGPPKSYQIVKANKLADSSVELLYVINHEKFALFCITLLYKNPAGALSITNFSFNTYPEKIWPAKQVYGE